MDDASSKVQSSPAPPTSPEPLTIGGVFRRLGPAGPLAVLAASMPGIGGLILIGSIGWIAPWMRGNPGPALALYVGAYAILGGLALLPTYAYSVLGGWVFGFGRGLTAAMAAIFAAAVVGHWVARRAAGNRVVELIDEHPKWKAVKDALIGRSLYRTLAIVTLIRLPPNSPFAMTNLVLAATRVHPLAYILGTLVGIAPRTAITVFLSSSLQELSFDKPRNWWLAGGGILVTLIVLGIIGAIANQALARVTGATPESEPTAS